MNSYLGLSQHFTPDGGEQFLDRCARCDILLLQGNAGELRHGQSATIDLTVRLTRQTGEQDESRGNHVVWQPFGYIAA